MSDQQACCAHLHIEHKTENFKYDGPDHPVTDPTSPNVPLRHGATLTREWWECRDCKTPFAPAPYQEYLEQQDAALWTLRDGIKALDRIVVLPETHHVPPGSYYIAGEVLALVARSSSPEKASVSLGEIEEELGE